MYRKRCRACPNVLEVEGDVKAISVQAVCANCGVWNTIMVPPDPRKDQKMLERMRKNFEPSGPSVERILIALFIAFVSIGAVAVGIALGLANR